MMKVTEMASPFLGEPLTVFLHPASDPDLTESLRRGPCTLHIQPPTAHRVRCVRQWHGGDRGGARGGSHAAANLHFNTDSCHLALPVQRINYAAGIIYAGAKLQMHGMPRPRTP